VELLSCLEVSRDAREIARQRKGGTAQNAPATTNGDGISTTRAKTGATVPNPAALSPPSGAR